MKFVIKCKHGYFDSTIDGAPLWEKSIQEAKKHSLYESYTILGKLLHEYGIVAELESVK